MTPTSSPLFFKPAASHNDFGFKEGILPHLMDMHHTLGTLSSTLQTVKNDLGTLRSTVDRLDHQLVYWKGSLAASFGVVAALTTLVGYFFK